MDKQTCKLVACIAENLPMMSSGVMQGWIDNPKGLQNFLSGLCSLEEQVLISLGSETVTLARPHDPDTFYRTRSGLYVWDDYRSNVVKLARPTATGTKFKISRFELGCNAIDEKIENALYNNHLFDESSVCAIVAELIARQPNGKMGLLVNNGRAANLFYTSSRVVRVFWYADGLRWDVGAWLRFEFGLVAGLRVFSPATET